MTPIARYDGGVWDRPWPEPFRTMLRIDSAGLLKPHLANEWPAGREPWALPVDLSDPRQARITAPREWRLYSESERGGPLTLTELRLAPAQCFQEWVLRTNRRDLTQVDYGSFRPLVGVAFSRSVESVGEDDIPHLDRIRADLGLVDGTGPKEPRYVWLGFFRVGSLGRETIIGVMNGVGYEGEAFYVVEIDGEQGRVAVEAGGGGC